MDNALTYYKQSLGFGLTGCTVERLDIPRRYIKYPITMNVENNPDNFTVVADFVPSLACCRPGDAATGR